MTILADELRKEGALICKWHVHTKGKPRGGRMVFCSSQGLWQLMTFFTSQAMISLQQDTMINCIILYWFLNCIRAVSKSTWYWIVLVLYIFKQHCDKSNLKWCWRSRRCYLSFKTLTDNMIPSVQGWHLPVFSYMFQNPVAPTIVHRIRHFESSCRANCTITKRAL